MSEKLSDAERERLCRALGFEPFGGFSPPAWPPLDTDDSWARKAMEVAARRCPSTKSTWFKLHFDNDGGWTALFFVFDVEAANREDKGAERVFRSEAEPSFPLALCRALLAALEAEELG